MAFSFRRNWRHLLLVFIVFGSLVAVLSLQKFGQDEKYHEFVDRRSFIGIPNFADVASNLPFLFAGLAGLAFCLRSSLDSGRNAWLTFFIGVALVFFGSSYYHWQPNSSRLIWDRLPMTIAFMGLFAALIGESAGGQLGKILLVPAVLVGLSSVLYWYYADDLRFYAWIQFMPLLTIPVVLILFKRSYSHQWLLLAALGCYAAAKVFELKDGEIFDLTGRVISGHSLKHLMAAAGCAVVLLMLKLRTPIQSAGISTV